MFDGDDWTDSAELQSLRTDNTIFQTGNSDRNVRRSSPSRWTQKSELPTLLLRLVGSPSPGAISGDVDPSFKQPRGDLQILLASLPVRTGKVHTICKRRLTHPTYYIQCVP